MPDLLYVAIPAAVIWLFLVWIFVRANKVNAEIGAQMDEVEVKARARYRIGE